MQLPKSLTTVTKLSKLLALTLFVLLPFLGFYYGINYKQCKQLAIQPENVKPHEEKIVKSSQLNELEINRLKEWGLPDPERNLKADLIKHPELIPYEGVLGGTMGFYSEGAVQVLTSPWVLAEFQDGHVYGHLLLKYSVSKNGDIEWEVIEAKMW